MLACIAAAVLVARLLAPSYSVPDVFYQLHERTPGELIRYAERKLEGHDRLQALALPILRRVQRRIERPVPAGELPTFGKGQQATALWPVTYDHGGVPLPAQPLRQRWVSPAPDLRVHSETEFAAAMATVLSGQTIEVAPGDYLIDRALQTGHAGTLQAPIVVRAAQAGTVMLRVATVQAFVVNQPYWVFENLTLRGVCTHDGDCEHAFHVVGRARATVLRNNRVGDFNAHIKVNGEDGHWPDDGLIQFNTLTDTHPRRTARPVTPIDLVAASGWQIADNRVTGFIKAGGDRVSYGLYMKGGGHGGRIERNLVVCTTRDISQPGVRVGMSFGGGGTVAENCRDARCAAEHTGGVMANNVVAHWNDFGIDVFRSADTTVAHNTLVNTAGIDVRRVPASATLFANVLDGRIRARDGGLASEQANVVAALPSVMAAPDRLALRWLSAPDPVAANPAVTDDLCGDRRGPQPWPGALAVRSACGP
ncbi:MAG TPA: right-handed parallel beta-helix repeat-containing protein [Burkholderiaceae bacterium]